MADLDIDAIEARMTALVMPSRDEVHALTAEVRRLQDELRFAQTMAPPNAFGVHTMAALLDEAETAKRRIAELESAR